MDALSAQPPPLVQPLFLPCLLLDLRLDPEMLTLEREET